MLTASKMSSQKTSYVPCGIRGEAWLEMSFLVCPGEELRTRQSELARAGSVSPACAQGRVDVRKQETPQSPYVCACWFPFRFCFISRKSLHCFMQESRLRLVASNMCSGWGRHGVKCVCVSVSLSWIQRVYILVDSFRCQVSLQRVDGLLITISMLWIFKNLSPFPNSSSYHSLLEYLIDLLL